VRRIDFAIIGAQKAGTTTLWGWLCQHSRIYFPETKEVVYFSRDDLHGRVGKHLKPFYRACGPDQLAGLADTNLMYFSGTAERLHEHNPQMKLIAILRHPVDRAYSAYWYARQVGQETSPTFEAALEAEAARVGGSCFDRRMAYVGFGEYATQLQRFVDRFGPNALQVILLEDLREPAVVLDRVLAFLELTPGDFAFDVTRIRNTAAAPRIGWLQRWLFGSGGTVKRWGRHILPAGWRRWLRYHIVMPLRRANLRPIQYPPMKDTTRQALLAHFRPHNEALGALIGRPLDWDQ